MLITTSMYIPYEIFKNSKSQVKNNFAVVTYSVNIY